MAAQKAAFAVGVLPDICAFHRYTGNSAFPYRTRSPQFGPLPGVEPPASTVPLEGTPTRALRPMNPDNARPLRITAAAGT